MQKPPKVFFGWWTVLACGIVGFLGIGFGVMGFSVLFKPLAAELGLSRTVTSIAASVQSVLGAISAPIAGWASDKYGPRRVMLFGVSIMSLGLIMMYFVGSLWSFLLVWGVMVGTGFSMGFTMITDRALVNWFVRRSGIAINTKFAIQALSGLLLLPAIAWLITVRQWRFTCVIEGIVIAAVCLPLVWFFVKPHRPEHYGLLPDGMAAAPDKQTGGQGASPAVTAGVTEMTFRQSTRVPAFWLLIAVGYVSGIVMPLTNAHCIPFLTDRGMSAIEASSVMGLMSTVSIPARLVTGYIVDRIQTNRLRFIMVAGTLMQTLGVSIFLLHGSTATIYLWFILYGVGGGVNQSANLPLLARYFGRKSFGAIIGISQAIMLPVGMVAPIYVGWVYDTSGSYMSIVTLMAVLTTISAAITCFMLPPKPSAPATAPA
jgi:MFS family permease